MFEVIETQPKEVAALISRAVTLDREIRQRKKSLEAIKAKLQTAALAEMENKNLRYVRYDSLYGSAETTYKTKLEIDNYARLAAARAFRGGSRCRKCLSSTRLCSRQSCIERGLRRCASLPGGRG